MATSPLNHQTFQAIPGVLCAFHSVIDGWLRLTPQRLRALLQDARVDVAALLRAPIPEEINTVEELLGGLLHSLTQGKALQRVIRNEYVHSWLLEHLGYDHLQLGGTSANMASALSSLGVPRVVVYAHPLTRSLAELFPAQDNLCVLTPKGMAPPRQAWHDEGLFAVHWILEYAQLSLNYQGVQLQAPRANRYIPAWNPINNQLRLNGDLVQSAVTSANSFSHLLLSGYHLLSEHYPDGSDFHPCVDATRDFLNNMKAANPNLRIHLEFASIASSAIRLYLLQTIVPSVHSLGCNEVELASLVELLDDNSLKHKIRQEDPVAILEGTFKVVKAQNLLRIHIHTLQFYLCLQHQAYGSWQKVQEGLHFTATLVAARAYTGKLTPNNWEEGQKFDLSPQGEISEQLITDTLLGRADKVAKGVWLLDGYWVVVVPTRFVPDPKLTVGLGDTVSAVAFLTG